MRRILPLTLLVAAGIAVAVYFYYPKPMPDFDQLGGVVLVYQRPTFDEEILVEALRQRLDAAGLRYIRLAELNGPGGKEIEFRVPRTERFGQDVAALKTLVSRAGRLEFRILANKHDDQPAIDETMKLINQTSTEALKSLAEEGKPPPAPERAAGEPKLYLIDLPRGEKSRVGYTWVEIGLPGRRVMRINSFIGLPRDKAWDRLVPDNASRLRNDHGSDMYEGALFYCRECVNKHLSEVERKEKQLDYFVLARTPETINVHDPTETRLSPAMEGKYLRHASATKDGAGLPMVEFAFNAEGAKLFQALTRKNAPTGETWDGQVVRRHLAILLDGLIMSSPTLNSEISNGAGAISGLFTQREVDELSAILRGGSLPVPLSSTPLREYDVEPKK